MEERREVREQMRDGREEEGKGTDEDGREERGEGYRRWMEERREVRDTDEGWKRGGR